MEQEIREALKKRTRGNWEFRKKTYKPGDGEYGDKEFAVGTLRSEVKKNHYHVILEPQKNVHGQYDLYAWNENDAKIIVNTPTYLEWCLSQIAELRKENQRLREEREEEEFRPRFRMDANGNLTRIEEE